jgi:hypothetical protein
MDFAPALARQHSFGYERRGLSDLPVAFRQFGN